jgi:hypothetical protein
MIRGKQEDIVGSVEDGQIVQEEEEKMKTEQEEVEGMKMENMEGSESNGNKMSSGGISGNGASPIKRTPASAYIARAVSTGVANDSKQALTPQF